MSRLLDRASKAQKWLMEFYNQWIPLDAVLELVRYMHESEDSVNVMTCQIRCSVCGGRAWRCDYCLEHKEELKV